MNANILKFIGAALLLGAWGTLAYMGKTPVDGFITAIGAALSGLGIYHVSTSANTPAATVAQPAPAAPQEPVTPAQPAAPQ